MNETGKRIKFYIKYLGITQREFCNTMGVSEDTLNSIFKRKTPPKMDFLVKMAEHYPVKIEWLSMGRGPMENDDQSTEFNSVDAILRITDIEKSLNKSMEMLSDFKKSIKIKPYNITFNKNDESDFAAEPGEKLE